VHLDNAPAHNSRLDSEKRESAKTHRIWHARYSPDLAPSDFFLFGYRKEQLRGTLFTTGNDPIFATWQIVSEILEMVLKMCSQTG
jgi:hypothetical protein